MTLPPDRFGYWPITERPRLEWPNGARVAFWIAPNVEHYEYTPLSRPNQPDIPDYALKDYGNRVGFWRMYDVLNKYKVRATTCLNLGTLDHFPEVKDAMIAAPHRRSSGRLEGNRGTGDRLVQEAGLNGSVPSPSS